MFCLPEMSVTQHCHRDNQLFIFETYTHTKKKLREKAFIFGSQFQKHQAWSTDPIAVDLEMKQSIKQQEDVAEQHHPGYRGQEAEKNNEGPGKDVPFKDMPPCDLLSPTRPHFLMKPG